MGSVKLFKPYNDVRALFSLLQGWIGIKLKRSFVFESRSHFLYFYPEWVSCVYAALIRKRKEVGRWKWELILNQIQKLWNTFKITSLNRIFSSCFSNSLQPLLGFKFFSVPDTFQNRFSPWCSPNPFSAPDTFQISLQPLILFKFLFSPDSYYLRNSG